MIKQIPKYKLKQLVWDPGRADHIRKHRVSVSKVEAVIESKYVIIQGKMGRWMLIGKTKDSRMLTVIVGERLELNVFGLVTARPSSREERSLYKELEEQLGG